MDITEKFFVKCVKAGISEDKITEVPQDVNYKALYELCAAHSVSVIVFYAVQNVKDELPKSFYDALKKSAEIHIMRDVQSGVDNETVIRALEENGVKFMPLKGYHLKKLYPKTEMRYTSDCDILIDKKEIKKLRKIVHHIGLSVQRYDEHHDIVYFEATKSLYEFHKMLFVGKLGEYFGIGFEKAEVKEGFKYYYELSPEDFYMTMIAHSAYHFATSGGVGIRHLTDIYIFRKHYALNDEYLAREFAKCGLRDFQTGLERLEKFFFEDGEADEFVLKLADYVLSSTVLANDEKKNAAYIVEHNSKSKTVFRIIFPKASVMKFSYPVLNKAVWLLPVFYVVRWLRVIFKTPRRLAKIKRVSAVTEEECAEVKYIRDGLGLKNMR